MSNRIFISYRREDRRGSAGRIYDQLAAHFGSDRIFMDVDAIQPGMDFVEAIQSAVSQTDVLIVIIGPAWLDAVDTAGSRRLDNPEDFVRLEVAAALDRNIRVIPVLVERAMMPRSTDLPDDLKPLARRNAIEISHTRFRSDVERLSNTLELALEQAAAKRSDAEKTEPEPVVTEQIEERPQKPEAERIAVDEAEKTAPPVPQTPAQVPARETRLIAPKSSAKPLVAAILSFLVCGGTGQIYLGQWKKGLVLIAGALAGGIFFAGIGFFILSFWGVVDAYSVALKLRNGETVGEWEFAWNVKGFGAALFLYALLIICALLLFFVAYIFSSNNDFLNSFT